MRFLKVPDRYSLGGTLSVIAVVKRDPTLSYTTDGVWFATRTPDGAGTLHLARENGGLRATTYGPGAEWLLDRADAIAGLRDDVSDFPSVASRHPLVRQLARTHDGLRFPSTGRIFHHVVPAIIGQKVSGKDGAFQLISVDVVIFDEGFDLRQRRWAVLRSGINFRRQSSFQQDFTQPKPQP